MDNTNPIVKMTEQVVELVTEIKEAKEDGKIRLFEWVPLIKEAADVIKASLEVKANDFNELTEGDIQTIADYVMESIDKEVPFVRADVVDVLKIAKLTHDLIKRER